MYTIQKFPLTGERESVLGKTPHEMVPNVLSTTFQLGRGQGYLK